MHTHYLFPDFPTVRALLPVARDLLTRSLRDDAVQRAFLTSFPDFQRRAARVDGALGRQRSSKIGLFTLCGGSAR